MTNFEKIKNMTLVELAYHLYNNTHNYECKYCCVYQYCKKYYFKTCLEAHVEWLKSEVEE